MPPKIVVIGSSNTDMIIQLPRLPKPGESIIGGKFSIARGGKGANQAVAAARIGGDVVFIARIGNDMFGDIAIDGFKQDQINFDHILRDEKMPSGVALIFVDENGENSIGVATGANANLSPEDVMSAKKAIVSADILLMQLETPLETINKAAEIAYENGVQVILNPAPAQPMPDNLFPKIAILTPNETEAELLTGVEVNNEQKAVEAASLLLEKGVKNVIITLGANGALLSTLAGNEVIPGFKVEAVDTTAAGDVFNGALAVALAEKLELTNAVKFANAAAALSVTKLGAQPSVPTRGDVEKFISTN